VGCEFLKAIIPVAGIGTRLKPLTNTIPKVLLNIAGKPMLAYLIDELVKVKKIDTIILIVGYLGEQVKEYINSSYPAPVYPDVKFDFVEQKEMLGLGHAVGLAKEYVKGDEVVIILGDTIFEFDLDKFVSSEFSAIGVKDVEDITRFGIVESEKGRITRMIEKPSGPEITKSKSAIAGLYYIKNSFGLFSSIEHIIRNNIRTKNEYQLTDALQQMVDSGEHFILFEIQNWFDCGKPETLLSTNQYLLNRDHRGDKIPSFPNTKIIPPVYIGKNCKISDSVIGPNVTVGDNVKIVSAVITNTLLYDNSTIHNSELDNTVIGSHAYLKGNHSDFIKTADEELNF
jgi:glucose-1-phosphate thymidylyltransferase